MLLSRNAERALCLLAHPHVSALAQLAHRIERSKAMAVDDPLAAPILQRSGALLTIHPTPTTPASGFKGC
jgi:hypothetical protein